MIRRASLALVLALASSSTGATAVVIPHRGTTPVVHDTGNGTHVPLVECSSVAADGAVTVTPCGGSASSDATAANQTAGNASLSSIDGKTPALVSGRQPVDGSGVTQPVSAAALPLPAGAATAANQVTGNASLSSMDGKLPALVSGRTPVDGSGVTQPISAAALPLPAGAATAANQTTGNATLSAISGQLPATLGQKASAASQAVVLASDQSAVAVSPTPTAAAANGLTPVATSALASSLVIKASAGNLYSVNVVSSGTAGYLLLFNATSAPADGAVTPVKCMPVAANTGVEINYRSVPVAFSTGITAVFSSTGCFSKTASASAFMAGEAK